MNSLYNIDKSISSLFTMILIKIVLLSGAVEYTECNSAPNVFVRYDTKQSDGEVPVMLEFWRMRSTPSLPLLPGPLWTGVVLYKDHI